MTIEQVLLGVQLRQGLAAGLGKVSVAGLEYDSRRVQPGFLFFAFPGLAPMAASLRSRPSTKAPSPR